jgi:predicted TIM-barrel fold metal-dependent hydrolase
VADEGGVNVSYAIPTPAGKVLFWANVRQDAATVGSLVDALSGNRRGSLTVSFQGGPMYSVSDGAAKVLGAQFPGVGEALDTALQASGFNAWIGAGWRGTMTFNDGRLDSITIHGKRFDLGNVAQAAVPPQTSEANLPFPDRSGSILPQGRPGMFETQSFRENFDDPLDRMFVATDPPELPPLVAGKSEPTNGKQTSVFDGQGSWLTVTPNPSREGSIVLPRPTYSGPINQVPDQYPADVHVHYGGYGRHFYGSRANQILNVTRDPANPAKGYALALQVIPQATPFGTRYYLAHTRDGATVEVASEIKRDASTGEPMLQIPAVIDTNGKRLFKGGTYPVSAVQRASDPADARASSAESGLDPNQVRVPTGFIPGLQMTYRGRARDLLLLRQIADLPPEDRSRVIVGLTAADPSNPLNLTELKAVLRAANEIDPTGDKLRMMIGETTLAKEGVMWNLQPAVDLGAPAPIHNLLNFTDLMGAAVVFHIDSGTPATLGLGNRRGQFVDALLGTTSNYSNVDAALEIFKKHPSTPIIWAHAAGVGRFNLPAPNHLMRTMERVLDGPEAAQLKHVNFDLSWDVVIRNMERAGLIPSLADLVNRYPDRFLYGSDSVDAGRGKDGSLQFGRYAATMDQLLSSGFLERLNYPEYFLRKNYDNIVVPAADRLNFYRLRNKNEIAE